jgi:hypothetical protein
MNFSITEICLPTCLFSMTEVRRNLTNPLVSRLKAWVLPVLEFDPVIPTERGAEMSRIRHLLGFLQFLLCSQPKFLSTSDAYGRELVELRDGRDPGRQ